LDSTAPLLCLYHSVFIFIIHRRSLARMQKNEILRKVLKDDGAAWRSYFQPIDTKEQITSFDCWLHLAFGVFCLGAVSIVYDSQLTISGICYKPFHML
jgi:hypothetical protein